MFDCYGIRFQKTEFAATVEEAKQKVAGMKFPVAVKLESATITHKTDVGGVILDVNSADNVEQAFTKISQNLVKLGRQDEMAGVMIQEMVTGGIETIIGVTQDPSFGPLINVRVRRYFRRTA